MQQTKINPWKWQDQFSFSQAIQVTGAQRLLFCAGQTSTDPQGQTICAGDMRGQMEAAMNNLDSVLAAAGLSLGNVVRLNYYTTDLDAFFAHYGVIAARLSAAGCQPSSTLLGVQKLAFPDLLVEIEATAAQ